MSPKIKKSNLKKKGAKTDKDGDHAMGGVPVPAAPPTLDSLETRHAAETKAMKAEVAKLKKERKKLPSKGSKIDKKAVSQKIRQLIGSLRLKHVAEMKAAGIAVAVEDAADAADMSDEDL
mmetsp:Transcript_2688/g.8055  ORF Transcript_2688/g.8055 Transcript_2688/m.8055 type:complete len:120 (-) Transcript_2688:319-678(-)